MEVAGIYLDLPLNFVDGNGPHLASGNPNRNAGRGWVSGWVGGITYL